ncbi:MAG TPA: SGNH/GDSL hydrolase family protein [Phycisphaerae bacterium]|nr:SGNH/GDSL hydrolase family protein [Phycisphaerae bacterium]
MHAAKSWFTGIGAAGLLLVVGGWLVGCAAVEQEGAVVPRTALVRIAGTELLTPPEIVTERVYTPDDTFTLPDAGGDIAFVGFYLSLIADDPSAVDLRVVNPTSRLSILAERVPMPAVSPADIVDAGMFDDAARAPLRAGSGIFWIEPDAADGHRCRIGVVLPEAGLWPESSIEVFASTTSTGAPLGGDRITLARAFYYMAVLGDSAMWGNGLEVKDKFSTRVARQIGQELNVHVVRNVRALSGATIRTHDADGLCRLRCGDGEVPEIFTSITTQANSLERPELYDLVLLDGCGNDVQIERILAPTDNTELLTDLSGEFCFGEMANLLIRVRAYAPQAPIVVTGYFPFVSEDSDLSQIGTWAVANGINLGGEEELTKTLRNFVVNAAVFQTQSAVDLQAAVTLVNGLDSNGPPIAYVDPEYGPQNATFASEAWMWGLTRNVPLATQLGINLDLFPEDPLLDERVKRCTLPSVAPNLLACIYGALGHPNVAGAKAYTRHIVAALRVMGILPDTPPPGAPDAPDAP